MNHQYELWGLNDHAQNRRHKELRLRLEALVKDVALLEKRSESCSADGKGQVDDASKPPPPPRLPRTVLEAVKYVLEQELADFYSDDEDEEYSFPDAVDTLKGGNENTIDRHPFYRRGEPKYHNVRYLRSKEFRHIPREDLDPLVRFSSTVYTPAEWFCKIWSDPTGLAGTVFEAMVAHYVTMQSNMPCYNCGVTNCLRWNGGLEAAVAWADMICIECQSMYEIKSKRDEATIDKTLKRKTLYGGSFRAFYRNQRSMLAKSAKAYIVMVAREAYASITPSNEESHRVSIHEIKQVLPSLCPESFITDIPGYSRIQSQVELVLVPANNPGQGRIWCRVPVFQQSHFQLAHQVYCGKYGSKVWNANRRRLVGKEDLDPLERLVRSLQETDLS